MADDGKAAEPRFDKAAEPQLDQYPHRVTDNIRYGDLDAQGHVNNKAIFGFFETGRVVMFRQPGLGLGVPDATVVLVHTEVTFLRELHWPGTVEIGSALAECGRSSYKIAHALFRDGACVAHGSARMVLIDTTTRRARSLPDDFRERLQRWAIASA